MHVTGMILLTTSVLIKMNVKELLYRVWPFKRRFLFIWNRLRTLFFQAICWIVLDRLEKVIITADFAKLHSVKFLLFVFESVIRLGTQCQHIGCTFLEVMDQITCLQGVAQQPPLAAIVNWVKVFPADGLRRFFIGNVQGPQPQHPSAISKHFRLN